MAITVFSDSFTIGSNQGLENRTEQETDLFGRGWIQPDADLTSFDVLAASGKLQASANNDAAFVFTPAGRAQTVRINFDPDGGDNRGSLYCKRDMSDASLTYGYRFNWRTSINELHLIRDDGGSGTTLASDTTPVTDIDDDTVAHTYEIRYATNGDISVYIDGVEETGVTANDTTYQYYAGAGFTQNNFVGDGALWDDFVVIDDSDVTAQGTKTFEDTFTEGSDTALASHTPDTDTSGDGWHQVEGTWTVLEATDNLRASSSTDFTVADSGAISGDQQVEVTYNGQGGANRFSIDFKHDGDASSSRDSYRYNVRPDLNTIVSYEVTNGSATTISTDTTPEVTLNENDTFTYTARYYADVLNGFQTLSVNGTEILGVSRIDNTKDANGHFALSHNAYAGTGGRFDSVKAWDGIDYGLSSGTSISATNDALTLSEYAASINASTLISATVDNLTVTSYTATISTANNTEINATSDSLSLTEYAAIVNAATDITATVDNLSLTTYPAAVSVGSNTNIAAATDQLTLTEYAATITAIVNVQINATVDALNLTTYRATIGDGSVVESTGFLPSLNQRGLTRAQLRRRRNQRYRYLKDL